MRHHLSRGPLERYHLPTMGTSARRVGWDPMVFLGVNRKELEQPMCINHWMAVSILGAWAGASMPAAVLAQSPNAKPSDAAMADRLKQYATVRLTADLSVLSDN